MVLKLSLELSILLNAKPYSSEFYEFFHLRKLIHAKKFKIGILKNKFTQKFISFR